MNQQAYILRHNKYIDFRIHRIADYVSSSRSGEDITTELMFFLLDHDSQVSLASEVPEDVLTDLNDLKKLTVGWDILNDGDILGYIYMGIQNCSDRKGKGQYFTPPKVVDYIVGRSLEYTDSSYPAVLDPSCGSGQFLLSVYKHLLKRLRSTFATEDEASRFIVKKLIYGIDIDPLAAKILSCNLSRVSGCSEEDVNIFCHDFLIRDDLKLDGESILQRKFDVITGNPPWRSKLTLDEKRYFRQEYFSIQSGMNTFTLFLERSYDVIQNNGIISFLIPEAYLNIKAHRSSRQLTLENASIRELALWGEQFKGVFAPAVSIILSQEGDDKTRLKNIIKINRNRRDESHYIQVPQGSYSNTFENIFNTNYSRKAVNILDTIAGNDCEYLREKAKFYLGIVTGNNGEHIVNARSDEYPHPILMGKDLTQYSISFSDHYFKYCPETLQQVAPQTLYQQKDKILYKFIGKRLTFAIDREGYYSLNNINGFIPENISLNIETLLSILNSHVMQYFYDNNFFTVKVLRGNLEKLPIKSISPATQKRIASLVEDISLKSDDKNLRDTLEDIMYYEYGIREKEAYLIHDHTAK